MKSKRKLRVFISYSKKDEKNALNLQKKLEKEWINVWIDKKELLPGKDWQEEIIKAVEEVDVIVICLSKASITSSGFFQREIKIALDAAESKPQGTIYIIPARLDEIEKRDVPLKLRNYQWVDLYGKNNRYSRLMDSLRHEAKKLDVKVKPKKGKIKDKKKKSSQEVIEPTSPILPPAKTPPQKQKFDRKWISIIILVLFVLILIGYYLNQNYITPEQSINPPQNSNTDTPTLTPFQPIPSHSPTPIILDPTLTPTFLPRNIFLIMHIVSSNETLLGISRDYTGSSNSVLAIQIANELVSTEIYVGQVLQIPIYEVRSGDSISVIANTFNVSQEDIIDANNIDDPNDILAGTKLVIPINCKTENCDLFILPTP